MASSFQSQSPDKADMKPSFRKPSNDAANRKYRRRSPGGSASSSSGGSPRYGRSPSPFFSMEDPSKISDDRRRRKDDGRELDGDAGHSRYGKGGDSYRHYDRQSHGSSHDYYRHDDHGRHHKHSYDGERSYQRLSSRSGRESRGGTRSDHTRHESEHDRSKDYSRHVDKYSRDKTVDEGYRNKDKERETTGLERQKYSTKGSSSDRTVSGRRHTNTEEIKTGDWDRHDRDKGGGRDNKWDHRRSSGDHKNDRTSSYEESRGHGKDSTTGRDNGGNRTKEFQRSISKEQGGQKDFATEKRKHDDRETERHKDRYNQEVEEDVENDHRLPGYREKNGRNEQDQDKAVSRSGDQESLAKKPKLFNSDKGSVYVKDGQFSNSITSSLNERPNASLKQVQETVDKVNSEHAHSSASEAEATHDLNAAKVAAMKAAELVNRNIIGGGYMSTDQKKKLLWGNKKNTPTEESAHRWDVQLFPDRERQEKFNKLMSLRLPWYLWPIVGCEGRAKAGAKTRRQRWQWPPPGGEAKGAAAGLREAIHCWTPTKGWPHCWTRTVVIFSAPFRTRTPIV